MIDKILCVSFPRSGHHLVEKILREYFGPSFHYCDNNEHCKSVPCVDVGTNYQKNHDFELTTPKLEEYKYFIQYRHPLESIMSWYELDLVMGILPKGKDSYRTWLEMLNQQTFYWHSLVSKWLIINPPKKAMAVPYNELVSQMESTIKKLIHYMDDSHVIDEEKLKGIIHKKRQHKLRNFTEFKYYEEKDFLDYEIILSPYLRKLDIRPLLLSLN